jgi:hypothetical protein
MDNTSDFLQGYFVDVKNNIFRIVKSPLYLTLFVLFLLSSGSSAYILFSSQDTAPSPLPSDQPSSNVVIAQPTPTDAPLLVTNDTPGVSVSPTTSPTPTIDPTAGWNTYTNAQYGYSIKYPDGWIASDSGQLEPLIPSYIIFNPSALKSSARTITISYTTRTSIQLESIYGDISQQMTIDNFSATEYLENDSDGNQSTSVIFPLGIHSLIFFSTDQYQNTLVQMLGTLQLTN